MESKMLLLFITIKSATRQKLSSAYEVEQVRTKDGPVSDDGFCAHKPSSPSRLTTLFRTILAQTSLSALHFVPFHFQKSFNNRSQTYKKERKKKKKSAR